MKACQHVPVFHTTSKPTINFVLRTKKNTDIVRVTHKSSQKTWWHEVTREFFFLWYLYKLKNASHGWLLFSFCCSSPAASHSRLMLSSGLDAVPTGWSLTEGPVLLIDQVSRPFASCCSVGVGVTEGGWGTILKGGEGVSFVKFFPAPLFVFVKIEWHQFSLSICGTSTFCPPCPYHLVH